MRKVIFTTTGTIILIIGAFILYRTYREDNSLHNILKNSGFSEIKPPNNLISPGTIVVIDDSNQGVLKIICPCVNAFGDSIYSKLKESPSTNVKITKELEGNFDVNIDFLKKISANPKLEVVKKISLTLSNVKIIEIPDDAVYELLNKRTPFCIKAITRRKSNLQKVTLIKRVIQADAEYTVDFSDKIGENAKIDVLTDLSVQLAGSNSIIRSSVIVGKKLFWGVDDDVLLGELQPGELPSTGSLEKLRLTDSTFNYRVTYEQVSYTVTPIKQPNEMACWITVYTMMQSWKQKKYLSIDEVITSLGNPWLEYYKAGLGLSNDKIEDFNSTASLNSEPPASYLPSVYKDLLEKHGPIWITTGNGFSSHAKLLIGIYGDQTGDIAWLEFIDPATGKIQNQDFLSFIDDYEKEARFLNEKRPGIQFRVQIIHFKETRNI